MRFYFCALNLSSTFHPVNPRRSETRHHLSLEQLTLFKER